MKGFLVIDHAEDWEQPLGLNTSKGMPPGGVLEWTDGPRAIFPDRKTAREAINRTDHYRQAFSPDFWPNKKFCKIVPTVLIQSP